MGLASPLNYLQYLSDRAVLDAGIFRIYRRRAGFNRGMYRLVAAEKEALNHTERERHYLAPRLKLASKSSLRRCVKGLTISAYSLSRLAHF